MRLNKDEIAKLKVLEAIDELQDKITDLNASWKHPIQWVMLWYARRQFKKVRQQFVLVMEERCTICGEPLETEPRDCPDPAHRQ